MSKKQEIDNDNESAREPVKCDDCDKQAVWRIYTNFFVCHRCKEHQYIISPEYAYDVYYQGIWIHIASDLPKDLSVYEIRKQALKKHGIPLKGFLSSH